MTKTKEAARTVGTKERPKPERTQLDGTGLQFLYVALPVLLERHFAHWLRAEDWVTETFTDADEVFWSLLEYESFRDRRDRWHDVVSDHDAVIVIPDPRGVIDKATYLEIAYADERDIPVLVSRGDGSFCELEEVWITLVDSGDRVEFAQLTTRP